MPDTIQWYEVLFLAIGLVGLLYTPRNAWSAWDDWRSLRRQKVNGSRNALSRLAVAVQVLLSLMSLMFVALGVNAMLVEDNPVFPPSRFALYAALYVMAIAAAVVAVEYRRVRAYVARELGK